MNIKVDGDRLQADLEALASFGRNADGSISRPAFSRADIQARQWFAERAREAGITARMDDVLNVLLGDESSVPAVWTGSHLDSVPEGGMFDGALGSIAALECLRRIKEERIALRRNLRGVAFSDEEGAYVGFLGSKALATGLAEIDINECRNPEGRLLTEAVADGGGNLANIPPGGSLPAEAIHRFVELHIEQGPVLDTEEIQIGAVTHIVGVANATVTFEGRPDHAGTTPLNLRRDALQGAATFLQAISGLPARLDRQDAVITCGQMRISPGAKNVVPKRVELHLDFRDSDQSGLNQLQDALARLAEQCADQLDLDASFSQDSMTAPTAVDLDIRGTIENQARGLGLSTRSMPSGASHDSQIMATRCPVGMIFVPSIDGRSHSRLENTAWNDVVNGANVLLGTLLELAA